MLLLLRKNSNTNNSKYLPGAHRTAVAFEAVPLRFPNHEIGCPNRSRKPRADGVSGERRAVTKYVKQEGGGAGGRTHRFY